MKAWVLRSTIAGAAAGLALAAGIAWYGHQTTLPAGMSVSGWEVGGWEAEHFYRGLSEQTSLLHKKKVEMTARLPAGLASRALTLGEFGLVTDEAQVKAEVGRLFQGPIWERALRRWQWRDRELALSIGLDDKAFAAATRKLWPELYESEPIPAKRTITADDRVMYTPEVPAARLDHEALRAVLDARIRQTLNDAASDAGGDAASEAAGDNASDAASYAAGDAANDVGTANDGAGSSRPIVPAYASDGAARPDPNALRPDGPLLSAEPIRVNVPVSPLLPDVTLDMLKAQGIERVIASYTTSFATSGSGRRHNVASTAAVVHDMLLKPGEVFDYATVIKETEERFGFREAPVILNGKMVPGVGGGICQVSTTLYNAVLRAGLEIVERRNHSLPVSYAPLGQDATFANGYINFKFKNSTGKHLLIRTSAKGGKLTVKLFGTMEPNVSYEIKSVKLKEIEPPKKYVRNAHLPKGTVKLVQKGKSGYVVETYRYKKINGRVVDQERISRDTYKAQPALYASNMGGSGERSRVTEPDDPILEDGVMAPAGDSPAEEGVIAPADGKPVIEDGVAAPMFE